MSTIVVTGAAGSVGKNLLPHLLLDPNVGRIVAIDRRPVSLKNPKVSPVKADLRSENLTPHFEGCDSIIHLAEERDAHAGLESSAKILDSVLETASDVGCSHVVLLSSALVYGAHADNPVPLVEDQRRRPVPDVAYAVVKAGLEDQAEQWAKRDPANAIAVLRPTATLSETGRSWIAEELAKATSIRSGKVDPPVQFLHHDDLATAVRLASVDRLSGHFNVAPDGWMSASVFRDLCGETQLGIGDSFAAKYREVRSWAGVERTHGLATYATYPWVVANDKLRSVGWRPAFSSEEAYVAGTPSPFWDVIPPKRRQEAAMGAVGVLGLGLLAILWRLVVRAMR